MNNLKNLLICSCLSMALFSCSSDDSSTNSQVDENTNVVEDQPLNPENVISGIQITDAVLKAGLPPTPNGQLSFNLDFSKQSGFQKYGFEIPFKAPSSFSGAYIQVLNDSGIPLDSYFDVPASAMEDLSAKTKEKTNIFGKKFNRIKADEDTAINVDFTSTIKAGTFCYVICLYDEQGNISNPVEVCVEVESWGGNSSIIANWNYEKSIEEGITYTPGVEKCEDYAIAIPCDSGQTIEVNNVYCYKTDTFTLNIMSDGTYEHVFEDTSKSFDYKQTAANCSLIWQPEEQSIYTSKGRWAYNEEENILTLVEFEYSEGIKDGEIYSGTEENGELLYSGATYIENNKLRISESYLEDGVTVSYDYYFNK